MTFDPAGRPILRPGPLETPAKRDEHLTALWDIAWNIRHRPSDAIVVRSSSWLGSLFWLALGLLTGWWLTR